jgi:simple sugar transport system ATP-binding protein
MGMRGSILPRTIWKDIRFSEHGRVRTGSGDWGLGVGAGTSLSGPARRLRSRESDMSREFLRLDRISKSYDGVQALKDVSLSVEQGKTYCLVGENGSGKSTLIKVIAGAHAPDSGKILVRGKEFPRLRPIESIRQGIQVIYQDFSLFPNLTAAENIALNHEIRQKRRWIRWREVNRIAREALGKMNVQLDLGARTGDLPVADRQLIAIARALLEDARLIVMDEPTTALTQREVRSLFTVIQKLRGEGISILFVSHKLEEVLEIGDRTVILRNGEKVADCEASELDRKGIVRSMTGRDSESEPPGPGSAPAAAPILLKVDRLSRARHFSEVSFELRAGEVLGITGLLGSGRTGLALSLFGALPADSGSVKVEGREVVLNRIQDALANGIAYIPEDRLTQGLFLKQSIAGNLAVRIVDTLSGRAGFVDNKEVLCRTREWMEKLRIHAPSIDTPAGSLSGGNQQRLVLAKWLAGNPRIVILNGPTVGVDVGSKMEIHQIIGDLACRGMGLLIISDDIPELMRVCHRILLMKKGRIAAEFAGQDVSEARLSELLVSA